MQFKSIRNGNDDYMLNFSTQMRTFVTETYF